MRINSDEIVTESIEARKLMHRIWMLKGCNGIERDEFFGEAWAAYWEAKIEYEKDANGYNYWKYICDKMLSELEYLKRKRNERMRLESKLSMNMNVNESHEEIGSLLFPVQGDFTNGVILWDWINQLEERMRKIAVLMIQREEDYDIMCILKMEELEYYKTKLKLRNNFIKFKEFNFDNE